MKWLLLLLLLAAFCRPVQAVVANRVIFDAGFLGGRWVDIDGNTRTRILGPFYERATSPDGKTLQAVRPLFSASADPANKTKKREYIWPLADSWQRVDEYNLRLLLTYYRDSDVKNPLAKYHLWSVPFYFQGRDAKTNGYFAVFPIGGQIQDFMTFDQIDFALFPLWVKSQKMKSTTRTVLWPIFSKTSGGGIEKRRVFPVWGHSKYRGENERGYILWPFYTWATEYRKGMAGHGYMVFPLWGRVNTELAQSWYVVPPFFRYSKGKEGTLLHAPWPFIRWSTGQVNQLMLFPIWGYRSFGTIYNSFYLWPIARYQRTERPSVTKHRLVVLPFYMGEKYTPVKTNAPSGRYTMIWPLASYRREGDVRRFRFLELWPLKNTGPIERSWSPLWTFFTHVSTPQRSEDELLWGLYRRERRDTNYCYTSVFPLYSWEREDDGAAPRREWNLLKGLIGYERQGKQRSLRVLYFMRFKLKETAP
ncbi:MAG TPA: hypothetical protein DCZ95_06280 [Verrucomicrobia bacterium]|nr:MAG: hypothetical protein A2X46_08305 [Lentisphaerae bacterium GWF2_57_35]HBA83686.1 hypothetical protein [Verrucomicrobiota bacterium]